MTYIVLKAPLNSNQPTNLVVSLGILPVKEFAALSIHKMCTHEYPPMTKYPLRGQMMPEYMVTFPVVYAVQQIECPLWTEPTSSVHCGLMESLLAVCRRTTWPLMRWMDVTTCCLQLHWGLETKTKNFETKTETSGIRSRESRPRPRPGKMNSSALESRNLGLESTTLNPKPTHNAQ